MKTARAPNRVSLTRAMSKLGYCSRSEALQWIVAGRILVNDKVEKNPHRWIDLSTDIVSVQGKRIYRAAFRYVLLHKPPGFVTTRSDERGKTTVYQLLPGEFSSLDPVGRLDKDSSGLLLFTNNNLLADTLTSPSFHVKKVYRTVLDKPLNNSDKRELEAGVEITDEGRIYRTRPAIVHELGNTTVEISISEGKNRQVRKMFAALGYDVKDLSRVAFGPLVIGSLKSGEYRDLTKEELASLPTRARKSI